MAVAVATILAWLSSRFDSDERLKMEHKNNTISARSMFHTSSQTPLPVHERWISPNILDAFENDPRASKNWVPSPAFLFALACAFVFVCVKLRQARKAARQQVVLRDIEGNSTEEFSDKGTEGDNLIGKEAEDDHVVEKGGRDDYLINLRYGFYEKLEDEWRTSKW